jgi:hypothetical protein
MNVWVYVEGESDKSALEALWGEWRERLRNEGHGIKIFPLGGKAKFLEKIGGRAARVLYDNNENAVVGLPDLYPNRGFEQTKYKHDSFEELTQIQMKEVQDALSQVFNVNATRRRELLKRFLASAFKHDVEMLLLAAKEQLRQHLGTSEQLGGWQNPVEEQDQNRPPKHVVEDLFRTKTIRKQSYRETKDAGAILRRVTDVKTVIFDKAGQVQCPVFKKVIDWIGKQTGIPAYH